MKTSIEVFVSFLFQVYETVILSYYMVTRILEFLSYVFTGTSEDKYIYLVQILDYETKLFSSVVSTTLEIIRYIFMGMDYVLKVFIPDFLYFLVSFNFYIFYPIVYIFLILYSIFKLTILLISIFIYLLVMVLKLCVLFIGNIISLFLWILLLLVILLLFLSGAAISIFVMVLIVGIAEFFFNYLRLRPHSRIIVGLENLFS